MYASESDIWLLDVTQPNQPARNLTNDPAWDYSPSWSPSGQSVAFISERDGDAERRLLHAFPPEQRLVTPAQP